jgi:glycosyltransferase involved in cell wall biosynthesis
VQDVADRQILYVAPSLPYPLTNGQALRHFHLLRAYAAVSQVKLVCLYRDEAQLEAATALRPYCESLHPILVSTVARPLSDEDAPLWRRRLELAATLTPSIASAFASRELRRVVDDLAPSADLVHVAKLWMVSNADEAIRLRRAPKAVVLDLDDVETVVKRRALAIHPPERWQRRLFERYDMLRLRLYQRRALRLFDRVFVCSQRDQVRLRRANVEVIPNGTTIPSGLLPEESDGQTLLSVGGLAYRPNVDGLLFFVREVLPLIRREVRGVRLLVVGSGVPDEVQRLHDGDRICVYASVPTVEPYYRQATAAVVSVRIGGGTRLRILEAFALGRAVVSTSVGSEGLEAVDGEHLLLADDPHRFAASCVALLREPALRRRLVARSRQLVEQKYAWGPIEDRVKAVATELLLERRR